ncbi:hypothetical protein KVR01_007658 [Diaporthe batatas]|uniref:uncharacterized protein n=1 Tax=Diaporthe batatas TaxID=748121 RepID=UPI001D05263B|nr:uncharacterized protein KVR01_007658 [Diaporthe batatas]KAG8163180.1 hypothetical protein KVR01_007658 [Diaporthe batatas]
MKFSGITTLAWLVPAVFAAGPVPLSSRQNINTITDRYLFDISLPQFITYRNAKNPATLDWTSDGCSDSPDNPLGFNFEPACYRHDFGYQNYRAQSRFTKAAKAAIDTNFQDDLKYQCESESLESICDALANVYYAAVKAFGGQDATKRAEAEDLDAAALRAEYDDAVAVYEQLVAEAKANGQIPS